MEEISLNILDIVQNSIKAKANLISITINENTVENKMTVVIEDNGCGMDEEMLKRVENPFFTTRTTRKIGLGIPMFKMAAEMTGGSFEIKSHPGKGTVLTAVFVHDSIDRMPLGDISGTIVSLVQCNADIDFVYKHIYNKNQFIFDTRQFKTTLDGIPINDFSVLGFIREYIDENYSEIKKGVTEQ